MLIDGKGCWVSALNGFTNANGMPALFLDRDNLLIEDPGFIHRPGDVHLMLGAASFVGWANRRNIPTIIVTNQSGISRGLFGWSDFHAVNDRLIELLGAWGAHIDAILACAWFDDGQEGLVARDHPWRKPNPGMILAAKEYFDVDLGRSWLAGDRLTDMKAAKAGGLAGGFLISEGVHDESQGDPLFNEIHSRSLKDALPLLSPRF